MNLATFFAALTGIGLLLTTLSTALTVVFRRRKGFFLRASLPGDSLPFVSILKPVCGVDDQLEENLESFTRLRGVPFELIVSAADAADPALEVVARVRAAHPEVAWKIVVGGDPRLERWNRKVARLIAAEPHARGRILLISDSNVRVERDDLARTIESFAEPSVGCVSNLFTGAGARSFGAVIESLHLLSFVAAGNVLAAFARRPCVVGKSMAISRQALDVIGGFRAFHRVLAEDQAIALAVTRAGYAVRLSPVVVRNVVVRRTLRRALDRQVRWNKIRYAFSKATYSAEVLVNPLPFALLAAALGLVWLPALTLLVRIAQVAVLSRATGARLGARVLLVPLLDLLQFGAHFVPYGDNTVTWRGHVRRIGRDTVLAEAA